MSEPSGYGGPDYTVDEKVAIDEIGPQGVKRLKALREWLYGVSSTQSLEFRYAPSLVARSEAELAGRSMPRFALRAYLDPTTRSFINARRLQLAADASPTWGTRIQWREDWRPFQERGVRLEYVPWQQEQLGDVIRRNRCIGDSLLVPPARLRERFHILTVNLGHAYGEGQSIDGTPFMQHIRFSGGGMCAQAACFMAAALLHEAEPDDAGSPLPLVHGVADVTAIVADPACNELLLAGLRWPQIRTYFELNGRRADLQRYEPRANACKPQEFLRVALRAYVASAVPVILPVDIGKLAHGPDSIYDRNRVVLEDRPQPAGRHNHAVVVVAAARAAHGDEFLVNDPATWPFLNARSRDLWAAATPDGDHGPPRFFAVTPRRVRLTLESGVSPTGDGDVRAGLFDLAMLIQRVAVARGDVPYVRLPAESPYHPGRFHLARFRDLSLGDLLPSAVRPAVAEWVASRPDLASRWCWLQWMPGARLGSIRGLPETLWVWDAEFDAGERWRVESRVDMRRYRDLHRSLLGVWERLFHKWRMTYATEPPPSGTTHAPPPAPAGDSAAATPASPGRAAGAPRKLEASLISSFTLDGSDVAARDWPPGGVPCEFYAFMHREPELRPPGVVRVADAVGATAELWREHVRAAAAPNSSDASRPQTRLEAMSRRLVGLFRRRRSAIAAIASFLPELTSIDDAVFERGRDALLCLMQLASLIRTASSGPNARPGGPRVLEIVAGCRVMSRFPARVVTSHGAQGGAIGEAPETVANVLTASQAVDQLHDGLLRVVEHARASGVELTPIALELEPGPLFVLSDLAQMRSLCRRLDAPNSPLGPFVGFNLDVAHWSIAGIDPGSLERGAPDVFRRVIHAHISDHGRGHFGDAVLGHVGLGLRKNGLREFGPWIDLIRRIADRNGQADGRPPFSGLVSVELEACRTPAFAAKALSRLNELLVT